MNDDLSQHRIVGERPPPYRPLDTLEWITSEREEIGGLAILVRTSITNLEQRDLRERNAWIEEVWTKEYEALPPEQRDVDEGPWAKQLRLVAPHIYDWNAQSQNLETGEWVPLAPPREAGWQQFEGVTFAQQLWALEVVIGGYLLSGKAQEWRTLLEPTPSGGSPSETAPDPPPAESSTPRRRRSSSTRSGSASRGSDPGSTTG